MISLLTESESYQKTKLLTPITTKQIWFADWKVTESPTTLKLPSLQFRSFSNNKESSAWIPSATFLRVTFSITSKSTLKDSRNQATTWPLTKRKKLRELIRLNNRRLLSLNRNTPDRDTKSCSRRSWRNRRRHSLRPASNRSVMSKRMF